MARHIAADPTATWRVLLTDDDGLVPHAGIDNLPAPRGHDPHRHRPRRALLFPGCRNTARHNDLDHVQAYKPGDQTTQANLMSLCRRHHRFKHAGDWTVKRDDTNRHHHLDRPTTAANTEPDHPT